MVVIKIFDQKRVDFLDNFMFSAFIRELLFDFFMSILKAKSMKKTLIFIKNA